ncbi:YsnF/AvaK domain-containing protein [Arenibaculum sp.]|uniref:YsnF/AvaK domain-containing protein n=1 Tax=Arenibaculum sp. TaxID=2865862 RepID=UPI002E1457DD|nr:YsnF/AvaK domain-containing protein [Arenibaculum sp.]
MADTTLVALYDDAETARRALTEIMAAGHHRERFWISDPSYASERAVTQDPRLQSLAREFATPSRRVQALTSLGVPQHDANVYAEGVRRGGTLLVGELPSSEAEEAHDIIERHNPADIDARHERYRAAGWSNYDASPDYSPEQAAEERIPLMEEQVEVGKRQRENRVRVRTFVRETPVDKDVTLHQERVVIERRPVERDTRDAQAASSFEEHTHEFVERNEEAVVDKEARVREELVVRKEETDRTERIHDTVRRTDAEVANERKDRTDDTP